MQVAPEFETRIKDLQKAIMQKQGEKASMRDLTKEVSVNTDFKALERVYKSMKQASNNIRIDVSTGDNPLIISNEEGDISVLNKII